MMDIFVPEETILHADGMTKRVKAAVALSYALPKDAPALAPAVLLDDDE